MHGESDRSGTHHLATGSMEVYRETCELQCQRSIRRSSVVVGLWQWLSLGGSAGIAMLIDSFASASTHSPTLFFSPQMSSSSPYPLRFLSTPPINRAPSPVPVYSTADDDDFSSDQEDAKLSRRSSYFLLPRPSSFTGSVSALTSSVSPYGSRPGSPLPPLYASTSEDDHEPSSPLLLSTSSSSGASFTFKKGRRWWPRSTKRKHDASLRGLKRKGSKILRHPLFPTKPITIVSKTHSAQKAC